MESNENHSNTHAFIPDCSNLSPSQVSWYLVGVVLRPVWSCSTLWLASPAPSLTCLTGEGPTPCQAWLYVEDTTPRPPVWYSARGSGVPATPWHRRGTTTPAGGHRRPLSSLGGRAVSGLQSLWQRENLSPWYLIQSKSQYCYSAKLSPISSYARLIQPYYHCIFAKLSPS